MLIISAILVTGIIPVTLAHASDLSIGAATWYSWWKIDAVKGGESGDDSSLLYGLLFSFGISERCSVSGVFLYGHYEIEYPHQSGEKIDRFDSDLVLNYRLASLIKLFAGIKLMGYEWELSTTSEEQEIFTFSQMHQVFMQEGKTLQVQITMVIRKHFLPLMEEMEPLRLHGTLLLHPPLSTWVTGTSIST